MSDEEPHIGDVWIDRTRANAPWPFGRVHVTDVQTIRDVLTVWIEYADSPQQTRGKVNLGELYGRYTLAYRPGARPAPPPPDEPGMENLDGMERLGGLDPAAALTAAAATPIRPGVIDDGPAFEEVPPAEAARLKAERDAKRAARAGKPAAAVVLPDVAEKDLPF